MPYTGTLILKWTETTCLRTRKTNVKKAHVWVSSRISQRAFPHAIVHQVAEVLFKEMGASLQAIGLAFFIFHGTSNFYGVPF